MGWEKMAQVGRERLNSERPQCGSQQKIHVLQANLKIKVKPVVPFLHPGLFVFNSNTLQALSMMFQGGKHFSRTFSM